MKRKKSFTVIALSAIALTSTFHLKMNTFESRLAVVSLENVEALAEESDIPANCVQAKGLCIVGTILDNYLAFQ